MWLHDQYLISEKYFNLPTTQNTQQAQTYLSVSRTKIWNNSCGLSCTDPSSLVKEPSAILFVSKYGYDQKTTLRVYIAHILLALCRCPCSWKYYLWIEKILPIPFTCWYWTTKSGIRQFMLLLSPWENVFISVGITKSLKYK